MKQLVNILDRRESYPIRKKAKSDSTSTSNQESGQDTRSVCFGVYKDDVDEDTGCILPGRDWIQCGEDD